MIWINNSKLCATFERLGAYDTASPWLKLHSQSNTFFHSIDYYCDRTGLINPVFNHALDEQFVIPKDECSASWQQINDKRALDLESAAQQNVYIMWSGGLDSTNSVAAVIKNCSKDFHNHVRIVCSDDSIWENPYFYRDQILPTFPHLINGISFDVTKALEDSLVVTGGMGDRIFGGDLWSMWTGLYPELNTNYRVHKDRIISLLRNILKDTVLCDWLYHTAEDCADHHGLVIQNCYDFFWWIEFNFTWTGMYFCLLKNLPRLNSKSIHDFKKHYVMWYNTAQFQSWSLNSVGSDLKYDFVNNTMKKTCRDYIFDLDRNYWYRDYKIKIESVRKSFNFNRNPNLLGITGQGNLFEMDLDSVTEIDSVLDKIKNLSD